MNLRLASLDDVNAAKCGLAAEVLRCSGILRLQVTGWSMLPTIWPGDMLVIERARGGDIGEGDIVLFTREGRFFVHRVLTIGERPDIVTKGDAMAAPDPPISEANLLGRVSLIARQGKRLTPQKHQRLPERAVAALVSRWDFAARVVVGLHGLRQAYWN